MAAVTAAITAGVAVASLAYTVDQSNQAKRIASQKEDAAQQDADTAQGALDNQKKVADAAQMERIRRDNQRRGLTSATTAGGAVAGPGLPMDATAGGKSNTLLGGGGSTLLGS